MSFILDALRKSEHERQRQAGPGIADLQAAGAARSRQPLWALVLGALLVLNVAVVIALVLRGSGREPPAAPATATAETAAAPATAVVAAAAPASSGSAGVTGPATTSLAPAATTAPPPSPAGPETTASVATDEMSEPTLRAVPPPAPQTVESSESYATLPTIGDVTLQGTALPELHLDLHVYASRPADRFVFINTRKYREGGQTPDGTTIERITPDGVVLNHHGVRFLLPRE